MYREIYVPVDNSDHSNRAMHTAIDLGRAYGSKLTGCHVYAARMHDYRFKQMEFTLPEEYLEEVELGRQRKIHDSLITMGLELISDCYLTDMERLCQQAELDFEKRMMDGKHSTEILRDVRSNGYDLVVLGALGIGRTRDAQIGSVCQRISKQLIDRDVWVVKHLPKKDEPVRDTIVVGVDGSPQSFGSLEVALDLAARFGKKVELVSVYDPYLHYAVFKGIVDVLTEKAAKIFRFEEQNQLHEEIIDTGLADIYQSHLNVAEKMARERGVEVSKTLLDGKAFQKVLDHCRKVEPWLLVIGRVGVHAEDDDGGIGSNAENLLHLAACDVLLTTAEVTPEIDLKAEESIHWTPEAEERLTRAPEAVRGIARTGILRLALEKGHSVVSSDLIDEAMDRFMPKRSQARTARLAEALAFEKAREEEVWACTGCATVARGKEPARCSMCSGTAFQILTPEMIAQMEADEGGATWEATYDGKKLRWTQESRKALRLLKDAYQRRRAKARIEKSARMKRMQVITVEFARHFVEEEGGVLYDVSPEAAAAEVHEVAARTAELAEAAGTEDATLGVEAPDDDRSLIARDEIGTPLFSHLAWSAEAADRILRVPRGMMRDRTQERVEEIFAKEGTSEISLAMVEQGIQAGLELMAQMIEATAAAKVAPAAESSKVKAALEDAAATARAGTCPFSQAAPSLNEVGVMQAMEKKRREIGLLGASIGNGGTVAKS